MTVKGRLQRAQATFEGSRMRWARAEFDGNRTRQRHIASRGDAIRSSHTSPSEVSRADSNEKHSPFVGWWTSPRSVAFVAIAIAVIATAVAIAAWLRPGASHSYSDQESAQAKANVCSAWAPVHQAVWAGTPNPHPGDPVAQLSVAANVRLAMLGGGSYLKETLAAEPATVRTGDIPDTLLSGHR